MKKILLFEMTSPYRDVFRIYGYQFGEGEKTLAIVGTMRGDEVQQQYICAQMVNEMKAIEYAGGINEGMSVMIIPTCNPFSLNVNSRFWSADNTDINRMFPGYDQGETTQRIAAAIFGAIKDYRYGIQMASFYVPGDFIPHVRMLKTGYEAVEDAMLFGLPYVTVRTPLPFDTTLLNYNWQIWETKAFSIYSGHTESVDDNTSLLTIEAICRFMKNVGILNSCQMTPAYKSEYLDEKDLITIQSHHAGILQRLKVAGDRVKKGDVMARITDPSDGSILEEVIAPADGLIFFSHHRPLVYQHAMLYKQVRV